MHANAMQVYIMLEATKGKARQPPDAMDEAKAHMHNELNQTHNRQSTNAQLHERYWFEKFRWL